VSVSKHPNDPKTDVVNIATHPHYRAPLDSEDPNYERNQYVRWMDEGVLPPPEPPSEDRDPFRDDARLEALEEQSQKPERHLELVTGFPLMEELHVGPAICRDCLHKVDTRSWWRRFFLPDSFQASDLLCSVFPRKKTRNSVTGREGYLPEGLQIPARAQDQEPFPPCTKVNPAGTCHYFKPKVTYR
jgi:hypothetical protein